MSAETPRDKPITAFNAIFAAKLDKLVKDIKKIRKDPTQRDKLKRCLSEAKQLKKAIKDSNKQVREYEIAFDYEIDEYGMIINVTNLVTDDVIKITSIETMPANTGEKICTINFTIKQS